MVRFRTLLTRRRIGRRDRYRAELTIVLFIIKKYRSVSFPFNLGKNIESKFQSVYDLESFLIRLKIEKMATRTMADSTGVDNLTESVEELRLRLEAMKKMMEQEEVEQEKGKRRKSATCKESIIDGSFLSMVFVIVLILIICVSFYAFQNLYYAVLKKFPGKKHTEL